MIWELHLRGRPEGARGRPACVGAGRPRGGAGGGWGRDLVGILDCSLLVGSWNGSQLLGNGGLWTRRRWSGGPAEIIIGVFLW